MLSPIYEATKLIGDTYAVQMQKYSNVNECKEYFIHKLKHTFGVESVILDIMIREKTIKPYLTKEIKELIELSAILHDLGRFYQFDDEGKFIPYPIFRHGQKAVDLLKDNSRFNNPMLLFAIQTHDLIGIDYSSPLYINMTEEEKKIADIMAKLLRDADKFENMRNFVVNGYPMFRAVKKEPLSEKVKEFIKNKTLVDRKFLKTSADVVADFILWLNDINFDTTRDFIKDINYFELAIQEFVKYGASEDDVRLVREMVKL
ncbi:HD domain-containing protein [bacterium]|nr:HD domain-containing protein [bacterium]